MQIPGIDPATLSRVQNQTAQPAVQQARKDDTSNKYEREREREEDKNFRQHGNHRELSAKVKQFNQVLEAFGVQVSFNLEEQDGAYWVGVKDKVTGKLLRKVAPDKIYRASTQLKSMIGLLIDELV